MDKLRTDVGINPSVNAVGVATSLYTREADYTQYGSPWKQGELLCFERMNSGAIPLLGTRRLKWNVYCKGV